MAYHLAQESLTLNTSVSLMGSSSNVFMHWGGFILKVFMYLFNKKSRASFGESVTCISRKRWIFLCFFKQLPNCHRGSLHKRDLLTRPHPNLIPQPWGAHSCPSHSARDQWPWAEALQQAIPAQWDPGGGGSVAGATLRPCGVSLGVFSHPGSNQAMQQATISNKKTRLILLLSPDIFSASATWACNRKIFIAQRIRCRGKPTFCCKYSIEGYVVFAFLNAQKKSKRYSRDRVASRPCLGHSTWSWR